MTDYAPFDGDGRQKVAPTAAIKASRPGCSPAPVTKANARRVIDDLVEKGVSKHGNQGVVVWIQEVWAYHQGWAITVLKHPLGGWYVRLDGEAT